MLADAARPAARICGLNILSNLAFASDAIAREVFSETLLDKLMRVVRESTNEPAVQAAGLDALGNLSFEAANRRAVSRYARDMLSGYALGRGGGEPSVAGGRVVPAFRTFRTSRTSRRVVASRVASAKDARVTGNEAGRNEKKKPLPWTPK